MSQRASVQSAAVGTAQLAKTMRARMENMFFFIRGFLCCSS
jgi:mannose/fructose/N-acetylgalactosamine-specific phosphotransferase system component IIC